MLKMVHNWKIKPDLDYMTTGERLYFKQLVKAGQITFFKQSQCANCQETIPQNKKYCSIECKEEKEEKENRRKKDETESVD